MRLKEFSCIALLILTFPVWGQISLSGTVTDTQGAPIPFAEVYLKQIQRLETVDDEGRFVFDNVPGGKYTVVVFAYEYEVLEKELFFDSAFTFTIQLEKLQAEKLSEVVMTQKRQEVFALKQLKKVEGTAIYAGKKTEVVLLEGITGNLASNNTRQIYSQVVGLNIYDTGDAGLQLNIGGRGLDPNRTANFNTRQNGYDISADVLGYPESYYTPPAEALEEIQVIRGAASLQYGTQFGGLINFKMKKPVRDKNILLESRQSVGSDNLFTSFNSVSGTTGNVGYYGYFNYKNGDGFRPNSGFESQNLYFYTDYKFGTNTTLGLDVTYLYYLAQQPGGLTDAQFNSDPTFSNRTRNWFEVNWKVASLRLEHQFSYRSRISALVYGLDASRKSVGFRTNRVSQQDDPDEPRDLILGDFQNWGAEVRFLNRYNIGTRNSVFLIGSKYYQSNNTSIQGPGTANNNADFKLADDRFPNYSNQSDFTYPNRNLAFFGENIFYITDDFSITPGC